MSHLSERRGEEKERRFVGQSPAASLLNSRFNASIRAR
jgi:hypothetical protein